MGRTAAKLIALGAAAVLTTTACAGTGGPQAAPATQASVATTIPRDPVTLTLAYTDDPPTKALIEGFRKKYPNVTIKPQQTPFKDYIKSIKLAMSSNQPPDIAEYNPGAMNTLVPAKLILDLNPYAEAYGWDTKFPPASLEVLKSDQTAKQFGTGNLYAVPGGLSILGVFYNKSMVSKVPTSLPEFEAELELQKSEGRTPLSVGALQVGGFHLWNALLNVIGSVDDYRSWVYGKPDATIVTDKAKEATDTLKRWVDKGYVAKSANATADPDAQANFAQGKSAFLVTGNWAAAALETQMKDKVGFFPLPNPAGGEVKVASGASVAYAISSKTKYPNVAAAFLDYMSSPEAAQIQFTGGFMPVDTKAQLSTTGLRGDIAQQFAPIAQSNGIVPFPDFASPGMIDKLTPGIQGIINGTTTTDQFLASLQESWTAHHGG